MNQEIRTAAKKLHVPFWKIADSLGISEATFTRMMRRELPKDKYDQIMSIIEKRAAHV
ncbi:MAG: hypothetical protein IJ354_09280 [Clostridia bacterium]|nr:hypothetical protein [Clostridia bacterium]